VKRHRDNEIAGQADAERRFLRVSRLVVFAINAVALYLGMEGNLA